MRISRSLVVRVCSYSCVTLWEKRLLVDRADGVQQVAPEKPPLHPPPPPAPIFFSSFSTVDNSFSPVSIFFNLVGRLSPVFSSVTHGSAQSCFLCSVLFLFCFFFLTSWKQLGLTIEETQSYPIDSLQIEYLFEITLRAWIRIR